MKVIATLSMIEMIAIDSFSQFSEGVLDKIIAEGNSTRW